MPVTEEQSQLLDEWAWDMLTMTLEERTAYWDAIEAAVTAMIQRVEPDATPDRIEDHLIAIATHVGVRLAKLDRSVSVNNLGRA